MGPPAPRPTPDARAFALPRGGPAEEQQRTMSQLYEQGQPLPVETRIYCGPFEKEIKENTLIIRLSGDLIGEDNGANVLEIATSAIQQQALTCIIDISKLRYINSSGIGVLITILTKFRNKGGEVFLMKPSENVQKLLVITKLNAIFQIVQNEAEVLKISKK